jgi:hypothetical protein
MNKFLFMFGSHGSRRQTCLDRLFVVLSFLIFAANLARATDTNPPPRLTIDLQDGSRIVGTSPEKYFEFHSVLLGDLKLEVKNIRYVECISSNATKVTTANGDSFTVSFIDSKLAVKTSFGKVDLPTGSIRKLAVSAPGGSLPGPPGLVAFWSGDNNGKDSVNGTDAELIDVTFADGLTGQAFSFNGISSRIRVPASPPLDLGADDGFTIMAWIKPSDVQGLHPICQWLVNGVYDDDALQFWIGLRPDQDGVLRVSLPGRDENPFLVSQQGVLVPHVFQHVAVTYDGRSGIGTLYVNGVIVAQREFSPGIVSNTKRDFWLSPRDDRPGNWSTGRMYSGLMDDIALYNRALTASEIQSVCAEENRGEPLNLPSPSTGWQELMR